MNQLLIDIPINLGGSWSIPMLLSYELAEFMGSKYAARTEVTKRLWDYIKANNLQNPKNKKKIICDETLQKVMKRKQVDMFSMTKIISTVSTILILFQVIDKIYASLPSLDDQKQSGCTRILPIR